jgi:hypothetical protein
MKVDKIKNKENLHISKIKESPTAGSSGITIEFIGSDIVCSIQPKFARKMMINFYQKLPDGKDNNFYWHQTPEGVMKEKN